jgi:NAD(P)H-hydrate epimerase
MKKMNIALKTSEVRHLDMVAQDRFGIPGLLLMEHASWGIAEVLQGLAPTGKKMFLFLCGKGNNGGDGFAAARHLHNRGLRAAVVLTGRIDQIRAESDAATNAAIARKMGIPIAECETAAEILEAIDRAAPDHLVDAVLGTGLSSPVRGLYKEVFEGLNARELNVTAVDMPSGLDSDTGLPLGGAVRAARTVTLAFAKTGLMKPEAAEYCGEIIVKGIGLPREVCDDPRAYL